MRRFVRAGRAVLVMACAPILWTACNGGDATAPSSAPVREPEPAALAPFALQGVLSADTARPGQLIVVQGTGFGSGVSQNSVSIAGVPAQVVAASPTRLEVRLPAAAGFPCLATGAQPLRVTSGGQSAEIALLVSVARRISLGKGESVNLLDANDAWCHEYVAPDADNARYAMAVINTSRVASTSTGFEVRASSGSVSSPAQLSRSTAAPFGQPPSGQTPSGPSAELQTLLEDTRRESLAHHAHLTREFDRSTRLAPAASAWRTQRGSGGRTAASRSALTVGQVVTRTAMYNDCNGASALKARVVYSGAHMIVLEDVASARAGSMDAELRTLGEEFDAVMYPLLLSHIGNPLALDETMQGDGRVTMLVSRYVNEVAPGTSGYVTTCNLYPRSVVSQSNEDELFYVRTPTEGESLAAWRRGMRSTVMHEAKHLVAFAERMARGVALEEPWMEEATARIAEELYSRSFGQGTTDWRSNTGWGASVACEVYECDGRPLMMWKHISVLHDYLAGADTLTPLGRASDSDYTYYASGWSLVRWVIDHYAVDEGAFLRDLVRGGGATGVSLLESRTGRSAPELLAEWSLAHLVDDRAGFVPQRSTLSLPSWHLPQLMSGLANTFGTPYRASPLAVRDISGDQRVSVPQLRGFSASYLETLVAAGASQLFELRGASGGAVSGNVRMAIVRVE